MDVPLAVLADGANVTQEGNLNLFGIFDTIYSARYPTAHPMATLVVRLMPRRAEAGQPARVVIRLMDDDGVIADVEGEFVVPEPGPMGTMTGLNQLFRISPLVLPHPGRYAFHIVVNGEEKAVVDFHAVLTEAPQAAG